ncbi:hypothetical protein K493DRAFT_311757 [Basidiobolus meristosporus CBS 931.73]|uniref:Cyclin N-terminal domain-containing protein n=1 Tax=Basidiobolus meristosporus CBS 931.73 TaxID=1314790 RepID=A0A1Y1YZE3_9FUNG|nr:hypothetical protein K493DRAFT_311757 [Basidiobolus meristosporus CBS 931.73]|eukprot:ORY03391.1 hypothetical protein K493DRAFT_311757 [Basidiobolus meristosporus CBS 931.73]
MTDVTVNLIDGVWSRKFGSDVGQMVPLAQFIMETAKRSKVTLGVWSLGLLYLLKLQPKDACFEKESFMDFARCGRRMFMASLIAASKFTQDKNYKNRTWASIMGVSVEEVNCIELTFLKLVDYQLLVPETIFLRWEEFLKNQIRTHRSKTEPIATKTEQKPSHPHRFSPYQVRTSPPPIRNHKHLEKHTQRHENKVFAEKSKSQCSLSYLLNSPPKEIHFSPEISNTRATALHNNVYLTP